MDSYWCYIIDGDAYDGHAAFAWGRSRDLSHGQAASDQTGAYPAYDIAYWTHEH